MNRACTLFLSCYLIDGLVSFVPSIPHESWLWRMIKLVARAFNSFMHQMGVEMSHGSCIAGGGSLWDAETV